MKSRLALCAAATFAVLCLGCESTSEPSMPSTSAVLPAGADSPSARKPSGETFDISKLDEKPVARFMARPNYPRALRDAKVAGEAVVDFIVDKNGDVQNAFVVRATHNAFGAAAVEAVARWKFKSGRKGGRDVNTHMQVPIVFTQNAS